MMGRMYQQGRELPPGPERRLPAEREPPSSALAAAEQEPLCVIKEVQRDDLRAEDGDCCAICLDEPRDARPFPHRECPHAFCKDCLESLETHHRAGGGCVPCPVCRRPSERDLSSISAADGADDDAAPPRRAVPPPPSRKKIGAVVFFAVATVALCTLGPVLYLALFADDACVPR